MESAEDGLDRDLILLGPLMTTSRSQAFDGLLLITIRRDSRSQTHVWAALVVMANPLSQYHSQMPLAEWNQEVQTLAPERSHQPFAVRIRLGSPNWRPQHSEAECFQFPIQISRENRIAVMNQKLVQMFTGNRFSKLLQRP